MIHYEIEGYYEPHGWELVTAEDTRAEARKTLKLYRENEPGTQFRMRAVNELAVS